MFRIFNYCAILFLALGLSCATRLSAEETKSLPPLPNLNPLVTVGAPLWKMSIKDLEPRIKDLGFEWLSESHEGLRYFRSFDPEDKPLTLFDQPVGETIVRAEKGIIVRVDISLFNRADDDYTSVNKLNQLITEWETRFSQFTKARPTKPTSTQGSVSRADRIIWYANDTAYILESSAVRDEAQYLRIRIGPQPKGTAALGNTTGTVTEVADRSELRNNVLKDAATGDVLIQHVPMVDQGPKGYCAVATAERIFRYYGLETDQHELAQISKSSAALGTNPLVMVDALRGASVKMGLRLYELEKFDIEDLFDWVKAYNKEAEKVGKRLAPNPEQIVSLDQIYDNLDPELYLKLRSTKGNAYANFSKDLIENIDAGIPLAWGVHLGMYPESDIPQASGGHMRLIIGYNQKSKEIIYSDSWGNGHEKKRMPMDQAYAMTDSLFIIRPTR